MAMVESCAYTFVIFVRWPEHIKIPSTISSSRILYSQWSSDNSAKFMPRRLIISHGRSVNEYRNLNFLDAPSSVTIDIQKGRVYLQRIIIAGLASFWDKRRWNTSGGRPRWRCHSEKLNIAERHNLGNDDEPGSSAAWDLKVKCNLSYANPA